MLCLRGDVARYRHQWRQDHHDCLPHRPYQHEHSSVPCLVHLVSAHRRTLHMHRMAQVRAVSVIHPIHMRSWCVWFSLASDLSFLLIFYFTHLLSHSFHFFHHLKFVDNLRIPPKESMASIDETYSHTSRPWCFGRRLRNWRWRGLLEGEEFVSSRSEQG